MSCPNIAIIDDYLTFGITTHDPDTGVVTDADSAPAYRIYEDETSTAILTGTMAKLDDANTTGFYTERVAITAANGFEDGKSYTIYIEATVDSDKGAIAYGFSAWTDIAAAVWANSTRTLTQSASAVTAAVSGSTISIKRGDTFSGSLTGIGDISSRSKLWFTVKIHSDDADTASIIQIEESAGLIYLNGTDASARAANGSITVTDASAGDITIALDEAETEDLVIRSGMLYDVQMLTAASVVTTMTEGTCNVTADVTRIIT